MCVCVCRRKRARHTIRGAAKQEWDQRRVRIGGGSAASTRRRVVPAHMYAFHVSTERQQREREKRPGRTSRSCKINSPLVCIGALHELKRQARRKDTSVAFLNKTGSRAPAWERATRKGVPNQAVCTCAHIQLPVRNDTKT